MAQLPPSFNIECPGCKKIVENLTFSKPRVMNDIDFVQMLIVQPKPVPICPHCFDYQFNLAISGLAYVDNQIVLQYNWIGSPAPKKVVGATKIPSSLVI